MNNDLPNFVVLGAQKSASTYLSEVLRRHPQIYMPPQEVRFFEDPEYAGGDEKPLRDLFARCGRPLRGIKRPDYLARHEVPARIQRHIPNAKLIAVLREPITRLVSAYHYYIKMGFLPAVHINEGLPKLLEDARSVSTRANELVGYGLYAQHIEGYLEYFPRDQILILLHEELSANPCSSMQSVYKFLGMVSADIPRIKNDNKGLYPIPRLRVLTWRNRFMYDYDHAGKIVEKSGYAKYIAAGAITIADRIFMAPFFGNRKPVLDIALRTRLRDLFRPDVKELERLLNRNLQHWK